MMTMMTKTGMVMMRVATRMMTKKEVKKLAELLRRPLDHRQSLKSSTIEMFTFEYGLDANSALPCTDVPSAGDVVK